MADASSSPAAQPIGRAVMPTSVKIRSYSDVVYLYPSFIMAIVCGLWVTLGTPTPADPGLSGVVFTALFFFNLSVIAFDYTRLTSIIFVLMVVIVGLLAAIFPAVGGFVQGMMDQPLFMNATFYWVWATFLAFILALVWIKARFDYWEIKNQELLHHHGMLGDVERWPAPNMRITKEINDVMEYALLRAGRLVMMPARADQALVIKNVPNINRIEREMQSILSSLRVVDGD